MQRTNRIFLIFLLCLIPAFLMFESCADDDVDSWDDDDDDDQDYDWADNDDEDDDDDDADDDDDDTTGCGPETLCGAAVACGYFNDVSECTPWYEFDANCLDMDAYIACNCGCLVADPECDAWIGCGVDCFNSNCM